MSDPVQPGREPALVLELFQVLVRLQENVLAQVERVFPIPHQPQQIIEDTFLPARNEHVISINVAAARLGDQVAILNLPKYQISAPFPLRDLSVRS